MCTVVLRVCDMVKMNVSCVFVVLVKGVGLASLTNLFFMPEEGAISVSDWMSSCLQTVVSKPNP